MLDTKWQIAFEIHFAVASFATVSTIRLTMIQAPAWLQNISIVLIFIANLLSITKPKHLVLMLRHFELIPQR